MHEWYCKCKLTLGQNNFEDVKKGGNGQSFMKITCYKLRVHNSIQVNQSDPGTSYSVQSTLSLNNSLT